MQTTEVITQQQVFFEREQYQEEVDYGQENGDAYEKEYYQDHEDGEEPLLYVDVNLGLNKTRIVPYQREVN